MISSEDYKQGVSNKGFQLYEFQGYKRLQCWRWVVSTVAKLGGCSSGGGDCGGCGRRCTGCKAKTSATQW